MLLYNPLVIVPTDRFLPTGGFCCGNKDSLKCSHMLVFVKVTGGFCCGNKDSLNCSHMLVFVEVNYLDLEHSAFYNCCYTCHFIFCHFP